MPFIHIKSLPFDEKIDIAHIIISIANDFSDETGIKLDHIHTTWEFYQPGHYAKGNKVSEYQPKNQYPIIVDLDIPDFIDLEKIEVMLESIANSISTNVSFPRNNIFINTRYARRSMVFDDGQIVKW